LLIVAWALLALLPHKGLTDYKLIVGYFPGLDSLHLVDIITGQVEHFHRIIKGMILQYMATNNSCRYFDVLPKIAENYNNTYHTTIKNTPAAV